MPGRRGNGDASYKKRPDGRWEGRVSLPSGCRSVYAPTRAAAKTRVEELQRLASMGIASLDAEQPFETYLDRWLNDVAGPALRPSTRESYGQIIRTRIVPELGRVKLSAINPQQLQALYKKLLDAGKAPGTVVRTHAVLHGALKQAMRWNLIPRNPADAVRPPSIVRKEMQTLDRQQVAHLIATATDETFRTLYAIAATTGLRRGELLALKWSDIDFERRYLTVRRTAQRIKGQGIVIGEPKTNAGRRSIRLAAMAIETLRSHRIAQLEARLQAGPAWHDNDLVFASAFGTNLEAARITRTFQADLKRAGLAAVRLHDLRHTAATLLIEEGVSLKAVQAVLGHSTITTSMDVYAHVTPHMQDTVAEAMDRVFGNAN